MSKNGDSGGGDVAPPPNTARAMELLRQVRAIQQQRSSDTAEKEDTFAEANRITTEIPESAGFHSQEDLRENDPSSQAGLMFPETLARFKIEKLVGEGGFARVFLAHDPTLDRKVALKVPKLGAIADVGSRERFDREARSAGILSHPSIVPVFESGNVGPLSYIAYEYCDGETLAEWIADHSENLPFDESAKIVERLAYAVEHAHQRSIIHRDLKPANILVAESDGQKVEDLRITDFGLAKNFQQTDAYKTAEGAIVGTPAYMSPEQALGQSDIGKPSDIYSLGVILYELLTGRLPFESKNRIQTLHAVANEIPTPPSRIRKQIPADLEAVCLKCIEKDPLKRYQSAFELASDLRNWSQGFSVTARRPSSLERMKTWCKRNPGITTALVGVTIGFGVAMYQRNHAINQTKIANQAAEQAQRNIELSQQTIKSMVSEISTSSSIAPKLGRKLLVKAIDLQETMIDETLNDPGVIFDTTSLYIMYASELATSRELDDALTVIEKGIVLAEEVKSNGYSMTSEQDRIYERLWLKKAKILSMMGRHEAAQTALKKVGEFADDSVPLGQANIMTQKAIVLVKKKEWDNAWSLLQQSQLIYQTSRPADEFSKMLIEGSLAEVYFWTGLCENRLDRFRDAEQTFIEGQQLIERVMQNASHHESMDQELARIQRELGRCQFVMGKYEAARLNLQASVNSFDALFERRSSTPSYGLFAFSSRISLIRLELETGSFNAVRELVLKLEDDFPGVPFEKFSGAEEYFSVSRIAKAHLKLLDYFSGEENNELADEHFESAKKWIEYLQREFPENPKVDGLAARLNELSLDR